MADNVAITAGTGTTIAADEVADGTLGTVKVQYVKLMDGTLDGTTKATVSGTGLQVQQATAANFNATVVGTGTFAVQAAQSGTWNVGTVTTVTTVTTLTGITNALPAGTNLLGRSVADASAATGGIATTARLPSAAASTNATNVKTSAARIYSVSGKNNATYDVFLVLYDATTNPPVPGTTTIRKKIVCPASQAFVYDWPLGLSFASGIGYAFTKLVADADTTVLVAADITAFNMDYV